MKLDYKYMLFNIQEALITHISPSLRAVMLDFDQGQNLFALRFIYHGEMTDKLFDLMSCIVAEIDSEDIKTELIRVDEPANIPIQGRLLYLRKEAIPTVYEQKSPVQFVNESTPLVAVLLLGMQGALLGRVTPELRRVTIKVDENLKELDFYYFYDGEISQENFKLSNDAINEACLLFSRYLINKHILRIDFPKKIPLFGDRVVFARNEDDF